METVMPQKLTVRQFFQQFPDDDTCLAHIMEKRYGTRHVCAKCGKDASFHRLTERPAFACAQCGAHVYPCAGTILQDTRTPLQLWFYALYLFVATRHGVSGKELQRQLGVTYKTAWRMGQQIRKLMANANGFEILSGHVEIDESYVGGHRPGKRGRGAERKTIVVGMKERGGRLVTEIIADVKKATLRGVVARNNSDRRDRLYRRTAELRLTGRRRLQARRGAAQCQGMVLLRLSDWCEAPYELG
jgi:hypothetical protein